MIDRLYAMRYAKALFQLDDSNLRQRQSELNEIAEIFKKVPGMMELLHTPQISVNERKAILNTCFKQVVEPKLMRFLNVLLENNRIEYLPAIAREYDQMVEDKLGGVKVELLTPQPFSDQSKAYLKRELESKLGRSIDLYEKIDPELLGGAMLILSDHMIDLSIRGRLSQLKMNLMRK